MGWLIPQEAGYHNFLEQVPMKGLHKRADRSWSQTAKNGIHTNLSQTIMLGHLFSPYEPQF